MIALGVVMLQTLCCLGFGAATLRALKIDTDLDTGHHWALSFATGFGVLGWLIFPLGVGGYLSAAPLTALLTAGALAAVLLRRPNRQPEESAPRPGTDILGKALLALIGVVGVFDFMEGIAPPADADTLAYHFVIAKQFLEAGRIEFIPEPLTGAVPFLVQMTYVPALALGGEKALTLWTMVSGWAAGALLFVLCRSHIGFNWSLAVTLIFLTTPAVIYGGGTGQVEPRIALFAMVAAWAVSRALETGRVNYAVLAGLGAGFFAAAKYTGLLFAAACGLALLFLRRKPLDGILFGVALLAAGFQWYAWNMAHTGDPVFPMLFQWLGREDLIAWTKSHDLLFKDHYFRLETPLTRTPVTMVLFPFAATLGFGELLDSGRVGFGPFGLLVLPFAVLGLWRYRDRVRRSPLLTYAVIVILFYVFWYFGGGSQRVRHLLPVLPLFLACVTVAAVRLTETGQHRISLAAVVAATLILQTAAHGIFALNYFKFLAGGSDRTAFLERNLEGYPAAVWINANLAKTDRVFHLHRDIRYYLDVPELLGSNQQAIIDLRPGKADLRTFHGQFRRAGVTHILLPRNGDSSGSRYAPLFEPLRQARCLTLLKSFEVKQFRSRTLPGLTANPVIFDVLRLGDEGCLR